MSYVLEARVLLHAHHGRIRPGRAASALRLDGIFILFIIAATMLVGKVAGPLVLMRAAILRGVSYFCV